MGDNGLANGMRRRSEHSSDKDTDITQENEIPPAEEITVGTANHETDGDANCIDRCQPT